MFSFSLQIDIVTTDTVDVHSNKDGKDEPGTTSLLLRMGPHRSENLPDILVECAINHPFFVKDKGQYKAPTCIFFASSRQPFSAVVKVRSDLCCGVH